MTTRGPYKRRKQLADRYRGLCACGEHAWAVLTRGYVTFVSPEDAHHLRGQKWFAKPEPQKGLVYAVRGKGRHQRLHRVILGQEPNCDTDHKDHVGTNNRRENLRPCSISQNNGNSRQRIGVSGYRGVHHRKDGKPWAACIARRHLGRFDTPEEAARVYDAAAIERWGEFATLNFPRVTAR
jgi:hypothetical protein